MKMKNMDYRLNSNYRLVLRVITTMVDPLLCAKVDEEQGLVCKSPLTFEGAFNKIYLFYVERIREFDRGESFWSCSDFFNKLAICGDSNKMYFNQWKKELEEALLCFNEKETAPKLIMIKYGLCGSTLKDFEGVGILEGDKSVAFVNPTNEKYHSCLIGIPSFFARNDNSAGYLSEITNDINCVLHQEVVGKEALYKLRENLLLLKKFKDFNNVRFIKRLNSFIKKLLKNKTPINDFMVKHYYDFAEEYVDPKYAKQCIFCKMFFIVSSPQKKYCSLLTDRRDCGKKARSQKDYRKHRSVRKNYYLGEMRETRRIRKLYSK